MPSFRNVQVSVITEQSIGPCTEYGIEKNAQKDCVTCYVESREDTQFHIKLTPDICKFSSYDYEGRRKSHLKPSRSSKTTHAQLKAVDSSSSSNETYSKSQHGRSSSAIDRGDFRAERSSSRTPDFHLLASLYLNGRAKPERRVIIYLDPNHESFPTDDDGAKFIKARLAKGEDGQVYERGWIFRGLGIETLLDHLDLTGKTSNSDENESLDEDCMLAAELADVTLSDQKSTKKEFPIGKRPNVGQIIVVLRRIIVGHVKHNESYSPRHVAGANDTLPLAGMSQFSHMTGLTDCTRVASTRPVQIYEHYIPGESPYATFKFLYRSRAELRKIDFGKLDLPMIVPTSALAFKAEGALVFPSLRMGLESEAASVPTRSASQPVAVSAHVLERRREYEEEGNVYATISASRDRSPLVVQLPFSRFGQKTSHDSVTGSFPSRVSTKNTWSAYSKSLLGPLQKGGDSHTALHKTEAYRDNSLEKDADDELDNVSNMTNKSSEPEESVLGFDSASLENKTLDATAQSLDLHLGLGKRIRSEQEDDDAGGSWNPPSKKICEKGDLAKRGSGDTAGEMTPDSAEVGGEEMKDSQKSSIV